MLGARALATIALALLAATRSTAAGALTQQQQQQQGLTLQLHRVAEPTHSETYRRRRLQNVDGKFEVMPLNPGLGTHYAWVYAGTPPQRASVITDTGSSLMAFPCSGCVGCGEHTDAPFVVSNSSTLAHVTCANAAPFFKCKGCDAERSNMCSISQAYMEGSSWEATVVEDIVYLGGANSSTNAHMRNQFGTHFMFGCQKKETGLFITQVADGIMGLANNDNNIVAKLHKEQKIPNKLFSLCFADNGGSMSIGVPDTARHKGAIAYAKLGPDSLHTDFYNVVVKDVRVGNVSIDAPTTSYTSGHFIVDSGTTDSYFPVSMKSAFEAAFEHVAGVKYQTSGASCTGLTDEQVAKLPTLQVVLEHEDGGDLVLDVTPEQYLIQEKHGYCANVFLSEFSGGVIGANIMLNRDVIFDSERRRVGFVDADCTYRGLEAVDEAAPSPSPRDHPAPGVVATSETHASNAPNATAAPSDVTIVAPSSAPMPPPTPAPSSAPMPPPTLAPTLAPTPTPTPSSTPKTTAPSAPTPAPTPADATLTLNVDHATPVPTATTSTKAKHTAEHEDVDEHPMVLTIVGTVLVLVFLLVVAASIKLNRNKKDHNWSRVKENEDDDDDDDDDGDDDDRDSSGGRTSRAKSPKKKKKAPLRSDEVDSDDNDDDDDDDEDEIFDRSSSHDDTKHDTRMLERL